MVVASNFRGFEFICYCGKEVKPLEDKPDVLLPEARAQTAQFGSFSVGPKELQALLESARAPFLSMKPPLLALESTLPSF